MTEFKSRLAKLLLRLSYKEGDFTLTSGKKSDYYFDCKQTALHAEGGYLIGRLFFEMLKAYDVDGVGGMTLGADPLISGVTVVSYLEGRPLPGFIIRKKSKGHGTDQYLEGLANFSKGDKVVLLEDVCTTGGTLITAAERVRDAGLEIVGVLAVLDREEGGREKLKSAGLELNSIFTRQELLAAGR
ncbi:MULTISPECIES: orotate phosphoribosyltransferase [unclassified Pseudodesulfovibrio]|uniref:orotate phosphoribosyltransferase n=1 Tax=unclassified Pseudodesulfovibrio TaxID=2661612 RepID=UPI000FEBB719|nr:MULTISPECIES: orotate phosphoribosyltransferase [unclassified Pseudodesulfovibrio]MCJ2164460.1 orotate phosphoribosyltransferase [Pseudodesulfovibrio sp. S3-i]RWU04662.1 orotate phosphoribosyltransferase [Pseudodesulfovibrio sp. S3]